MPIGVSFDGLHSGDRYGLWISEKPDYGSPEPKLNTVEIPGADGILDFTDANSGEVRFENRSIRIVFAAMVNSENQASLISEIMNDLHGKAFQRIVFDENPDWYYSGRCTVEITERKPWKIRCQVTVDAAPYCLKLQKTIVDITPTGYSNDKVSLSYRKIDGIERENGGTDLYPSTAFEFGTSVEADGSFTDIQSIVVNWDASQDAVYYAVEFDFVGRASYSYGLSSAEYNAGSITFVIANSQTLSSNIANCYRIRTVGFNAISVEAYSNNLSFTKSFNNSRKSVLPVFYIVPTDQSVETVNMRVNGKNFAVTANTAYSNEDTLLTSGDNSVTIFNEDGDANYIYSARIEFREGAL